MAIMTYHEHKQMLNRIIKDAVQLKEYSLKTKTQTRIVEILNHYGKEHTHVRSWISVETFQRLRASENTTVEDNEQMSKLAWCYQILGTGLMIMDDILDKDHKRYSRVTWYRINHMKDIVIDDVLLINSLAELLLNKYFAKHDCFVCNGCGKYPKWILTTAITHCNAEQLQRLEDFCGKENDECVRKVIELYRELMIPEMARTELHRMDSILEAHLQQLQVEEHTLTSVFQDWMARYEVIINKNCEI